MLEEEHASLQARVHELEEELEAALHRSMKLQSEVNIMSAVRDLIDRSDTGT